MPVQENMPIPSEFRSQIKYLTTRKQMQRLVSLIEPSEKNEGLKTWQALGTDLCFGFNQTTNKADVRDIFRASSFKINNQDIDALVKESVHDSMSDDVIKTVKLERLKKEIGADHVSILEKCYGQDIPGAPACWLAGLSKDVINHADTFVEVHTKKNWHSETADVYYKIKNKCALSQFISPHKIKINNPHCEVLYKETSQGLKLIGFASQNRFIRDISRGNIPPAFQTTFKDTHTVIPEGNTPGGHVNMQIKEKPMAVIRDWLLHYSETEITWEPGELTLWEKMKKTFYAIYNPNNGGRSDTAAFLGGFNWGDKKDYKKRDIPELFFSLLRFCKNIFVVTPFILLPDLIKTTFQHAIENIGSYLKEQWNKPWREQNWLGMFFAGIGGAIASVFYGIFAALTFITKSIFQPLKAWGEREGIAAVLGAVIAVCAYAFAGLVLAPAYLAAAGLILFSKLATAIIVAAATILAVPANHGYKKFKEAFSEPEIEEVELTYNNIRRSFDRRDSSPPSPGSGAARNPSAAAPPVASSAASGIATNPYCFATRNASTPPTQSPGHTATRRPSAH